MQVEYLDGVPKVTRERVDEILATLSVVSPPIKGLRVTVAPAPCVGDPSGKVGFGAYLPRDKWLVLAGLHPAPDVSAKDWRAKHLPEIIAHEWAHMEQHRDGRPIQERGVEVRARGLLRRAFR